MTINRNFERFLYFNFEADFLEKTNLFKKLKYRFLVEVLRLKTHHFHTKLPDEKPMLRQIEWCVQNGPITKSGVLPVTNLFF